MIASAEPRIGSPIRSPAGHACPFDETERALEPLLDRVPITRVYNATALDRLGLPVWGAVTPLAADLTVHAGKGLTDQAARISAVMEAIERVCAEAVEPTRVRRSSYMQLAAEDPAGVMDPDDCDLPFDSLYAPEAPVNWILGQDLVTEAPVWVALDLVVSPALEGLRWGTATNGLAAGNTRLEAILHGLYEVIERDADAERQFLRCFGEGDERVPMRLLRHDTLPAHIAGWVQTLQAASVFVGIEEITHDVGVPVFRALISDRGFPGREGTSVAFEGLGCDLDSAHAVLRALSEAAQAHTTVLLGARDHFDGETPPAQTERQFLAALMTPTRRTELVCTAPPETLEARLAHVLDQLRAAGLPRCVVVDLTRQDLAIPVVRVLVPGACGPHAHSAGRPPLRLLRHLV